MLSSVLADASAGSGATITSSVPLLRIDYVFATREHWQPVSARIVDTQVSDHRPVIAVISRR